VRVGPAALPAALGKPDAVVYQGVFRWSTTPADLPDAGVWVSSWSDVPMWDSIADSREYEVTRDPAALAKARAAFDYVDAGRSATFARVPAPRSTTRSRTVAATGSRHWRPTPTAFRFARP
jgi:hypothetical protein